MLTSTGLDDCYPNTSSHTGERICAICIMVFHHINVNCIALNPDKRYIGVKLQVLECFVGRRRIPFLPFPFGLAQTIRLKVVISIA
jgi:hypothetical protein